jgi:hypothetical protein
MAASFLCPRDELDETGPASGIRRRTPERSVLLVAQDEATLARMGNALARREFEVSAESSFDRACELIARAPGAFAAIVAVFDPTSPASIHFAERVRDADPIAGVVLWSEEHLVPSVRGVDVSLSSPSLATLADALTVLVDAP